MKKISSKLKLLANSIGRRSESTDSKQEEESKDIFEISAIDDVDKGIAGIDFLQRMDSNGFVLNSSLRKQEKLSTLPPESTTMRYFLTEKIGEGAYGKVYRSVDLKTKKEFAIKISKLTDDNRKNLMTELELMMKLKSPHIVAVYEGFIVVNKLWLVMEHCIGGSVVDVMKMRKIEFLNESLMKGVIASLLLALNFLHEHRVIHRDIKASNLVLTVGGKIKLIDFGVSAEIKEGEEYKNTVVGSPYWMAPEVIEGKNYNEKADIWSVGMTMLELCEPKHPLFCIHPVSVVFKIVTADPPRMRNSSHPDFSSEVYDFFSKCIQKDPAERLCTQALLEHAWVQQTVGGIVPGDEKNSSVSCVESLEHLFLDYIFDDEVDVLPSNDDDELDATQDQNANLPDRESIEESLSHVSDSSNTTATELLAHPPVPSTFESSDKLPVGLLGVHTVNNSVSRAKSSISRQGSVRSENGDAIIYPSAVSTYDTSMSFDTDTIKPPRRLLQKKVSFASNAYDVLDTRCDSRAGASISRQGSLRSDDVDPNLDALKISADETSICIDSTQEKETRFDLNKKVSFSSEASEDDKPRRQTWTPITVKNISLHTHPNARNSEVPSLNDIPMSLRQPSSQSFIQRLLNETVNDDDRSCSSTYRSLRSFEDDISLSCNSMSSSNGTVKSSVRGEILRRQLSFTSACSSLSDSSCSSNATCPS